MANSANTSPQANPPPKLRIPAVVIKTEPIVASESCVNSPGTTELLLQEDLRTNSASSSVTCSSCGEMITDRFLIQVSGSGGCWHGSCLRCSICRTPLDAQPSCFLRAGHVYCKQDYNRTFRARCARCGRSISATDWVRRAREHVYHLACFACDACRRQLSTGEEFALHEGKVLCKAHYLDGMDAADATSSDETDPEGGGRGKCKRVRTTFSEEQLQILQANFLLDSNPDGQDLERIAALTGLSKRVTQVWFQNMRARHKKHVNSNNNHPNTLSANTQNKTPQSGSGGTGGGGRNRSTGNNLNHSIHMMANSDGLNSHGNGPGSTKRLIDSDPQHAYSLQFLYSYNIQDENDGTSSNDSALRSIRGPEL